MPEGIEGRKIPGNEAGDRNRGGFGPTAILGMAASLSAALGSILIVVIMVLINADVAGRYFFGAPVPIVAEIVSVSIVSVAFLQLSDCVRAGRMIQSDMLLGRIVARWPSVGKAIESFHHAVGTVMIAILVWHIQSPTLASWSQSETIGISGIFTLPLWPFYMAVLAGALLTLLQYASRTVLLAGQALKGETGKGETGSGNRQTGDRQIGDRDE